MFSIARSGHSVFLQSPGSTIELWPQYGAILNGWQVRMGDRKWQIIEGYESPEDFKNNCEKKGFRSCKLSPYVCRINKGNYRFDDKQFHIGKYKLGGNSLHGLLYDAAFEIESSHAAEYFATVSMNHIYESVDTGYPFNYSIHVTYVLHPDNQLDITTTITNKSSESMPIADGWHPYFSLGKKVDELKLIINSDKLVEFDDRLIPTGNLTNYHSFQVPDLINDEKFDTCFVLRNPLHGAACRLINEEDNFQLVVDAGKTYPYLQLFTPADRKSIAIENLSAAPDAFNNQMGLSILGAGQVTSFGLSYKLEAIHPV